MTTSGRTGRADLLRLFAALGKDALDRAAPFVGYHRRQTEEPREVSVEPRPKPPTQKIEVPSTEAPAPTPRQRYWAVAKRERRPPDEADIRPPDWYRATDADEKDETIWDALRRDRVAAKRPDPQGQALLPWSRLGPWLRHALGDTRPGREPDVDRLIRQISAGYPIRHIPFRSRRGWAPHIAILLGHAPHLGAYREDINQVWKRLLRERGHSSLTVEVVEAPDHAGRFTVRSATQRNAQPRRWSTPSVGTPLLIVGDLGMLVSSEARESLPDWLRLGQQLRAADIQPLALCPVPASRVSLPLAQHYAIHEWAATARLAHPCRPTAAPQASNIVSQDIHRLAAFLAPLLYAEPALVRALRTHLGLHPVCEADLCRHPKIANDGTHVAWIGNAHEEGRQQAFATLARTEQRWLVRLIDTYHGNIPSIANTERGLVAHYLRHLPPAERQEVLSDDELHELEHHRALVVRLCHESGDESFLRDNWLPDHLARQGNELLADSPQLLALWASQRRGEFAQGNLKIPAWLPPDVDLRFFLNANNRPPQPCLLIQRGDRLYVDQQSPTLQGGCALAESTLQGGMVRIEVSAARSHGQALAVTALPLDLGQLPADAQGAFIDLGGERLWLETQRPAWAQAMGRDTFGLYADLILTTTHGSASQRLRWIEPGTFLMGSPPGEPGRRGNEGPQHPVTLTEGYWLADTACTQALWQAVMGNNPSHFKDDPQRPVEQVSWEDVQAFLNKLAALLPGSAATLPTEAEWEYACRAGTTTAFNFGSEINEARVNYDGKRNGTVAVKSLPPNGWGLFEMHGNVWEWCADMQRTYDGQPQVNPVEPGEAAARRAVRGSSWIYGARLAGSAFRGASRPGLRRDALGFRFALRSTGAGQVLSGGAPLRSKSVLLNRAFGELQAKRAPRKKGKR